MATKPTKTATRSKTTPTRSTKVTKSTKPTSRTAARKAKAASSPVSAAPKPVLVESVAPSEALPVLRKKELIDVVTERSGIKKKDAKPVVEAMLAVLGQAIFEGRDLNLQPMGRSKINRQKAVSGGQVTVMKLRQSDARTTQKDTLAEAAE